MYRLLSTCESSLKIVLLCCLNRATAACPNAETAAMAVDEFKAELQNTFEVQPSRFWWNEDDVCDGGLVVTVLPTTRFVPVLLQLRDPSSDIVHANCMLTET